MWGIYWGVPCNTDGCQQAATGNAYCGMGHTFMVNPTGIREYIGSELLSSLVVGQKYYISMKVCFAGHANIIRTASNKIGVKFSTVKYSLSNPAPTDNTASFYSDSIITDTVNWTLIKGSFVADSNYTKIIIGNFFDNAHTDTINVYGTPGVSTYLIDDICVSTDSLTCYSTVGINEIRNEEELILFPNPFSNKMNITVKRNEFVEVSLYDVTSRKIFNQSFTNSVAINTEQLAKGIYLYEVRNKNGVIKQGKVVKD